MAQKSERWRKVDKPTRCTNILCETDDGESMDFKICIKNGKRARWKKVK